VVEHSLHRKVVVSRRGFDAIEFEVCAEQVVRQPRHGGTTDARNSMAAAASSGHTSGSIEGVTPSASPGLARHRGRIRAAHPAQTINCAERVGSADVDREEQAS